MKILLITIVGMLAILVSPLTANAWEGHLDTPAVPTTWDFYTAFEESGTFQGVSPHSKNEYDEPRSTLMIKEEINGQTVISIYAAKNVNQKMAFGGQDQANRNISFQFVEDGVQRKSWVEDASVSTGYRYHSGSDNATAPQNARALYFANSVEYFEDQADEFYPSYTYTPPVLPDPDPEPEPEEPSLLNTGYMDSNARIDTRFLDHVATTITIILTFILAAQFRWRGRRE